MAPSFCFCTFQNQNIHVSLFEKHPQTSWNQGAATTIKVDVQQNLSYLGQSTWLDISCIVSRDSIPIVLCYSTRFKSPNKQGGTAGGVEPHDCQDMGGSIVAWKRGCLLAHVFTSFLQGVKFATRWRVTTVSPCLLGKKSQVAHFQPIIRTSVKSTVFSRLRLMVDSCSIDLLYLLDLLYYK